MKHRKSTKWKWHEILLMTALCGIAVCALYQVASYGVKTHRAKKEFGELSQIVHAEPAQSEAQSTAPDAMEQVQPEDPRMAGVRSLQQQNDDCAVWLSAADTAIDYPVMLTPEDPQYYLRRNFEKKYSIAGTPFMDARNLPEVDANVIIHGHNMKDGSMFRDLEKYLDPDYAREHAEFELIFPGEVRTYRLAAVLHEELTEENLPEYTGIPRTRQEFDSYVQNLGAKSLYDGADAQWGCQLLTLSTCDNKTQNGRIMVIAVSDPIPE